VSPLAEKEKAGQIRPFPALTAAAREPQ